MLCRSRCSIKHELPAVRRSSGSSGGRSVGQTGGRRGGRAGGGRQRGRAARPGLLYATRAVEFALVCEMSTKFGGTPPCGQILVIAPRPPKGQPSRLFATLISFPPFSLPFQDLHKGSGCNAAAGAGDGAADAGLREPVGPPPAPASDQRSRVGRLALVGPAVGAARGGLGCRERGALDGLLDLQLHFWALAKVQNVAESRWVVKAGCGTPALPRLARDLSPGTTMRSPCARPVSLLPLRRAGRRARWRSRSWCSAGAAASGGCSMARVGGAGRPGN